MVTPRVVQEVRKHFNCPQLEGAELEDQGEDGTAITHWEKRVFEVWRSKHSGEAKELGNFTRILFTERSDDRNAYAESGILETDVGIDGGHWLV